MRHLTDYPFTVYSTADGAIGERHTLRAVDFAGNPLLPSGLIPVPEGATLAIVPQRLAVGLDAHCLRSTVAARDGGVAGAPLPFGYMPTRDVWVKAGSR